MTKLWRDYSLLWVMLVIFAATMAVESFLRYSQMETEYRWHHDILTMHAFWLSVVQQLAGRIAASILVLIVFTVLRAWFVYTGSPVSKDGSEERTSLLKIIRANVDDLRTEIAILLRRS